jgi:hypothetical protein
MMFRWGEFSQGWGLALGLCHFHEHWSLRIQLVFFSAYIRLCASHTEPHEMMESFGFSWRWGQEWGNGDAIHFNWGSRCKIVHMPWGWTWQRSSYLMADGRTWAHELARYRSRHDSVPVEIGINPNTFFFFAQDIPRWQREFSYRYVLRNGTVQERVATVTITEMEWRMRWLCWLPWPRKVRRSIDVSFSDEVGERSGSWKGGCTGCSYDLRKNETAEECLRRMERDRKF